MDNNMIQVRLCLVDHRHSLRGALKPWARENRGRDPAFRRHGVAHGPRRTGEVWDLICLSSVASGEEDLVELGCDCCAEILTITASLCQDLVASLPLFAGIASDVAEAPIQ